MLWCQRIILISNPLSSYGEPGYHIILITLKHLFPESSIETINIYPLTYNVLVEEVLAPEAAVCLIVEDLKTTRSKAIDILHESYTFGNNLHDPDSPENAAHLKSTAKKGRKPPYGVSVYREWIVSGTALPVNEWFRAEKRRMTVPSPSLSDEELRIKQEEMDLDPLADVPGVLSCRAGNRDDPINLTFDDDT